MQTSLTELKRERDVVQRILGQLDYASTKEIAEIELTIFEGKHFRDFNLGELLNRVTKIATKLKNIEVINGFVVSNYEQISKDLLITFDVKKKSQFLASFGDRLNNDIARIELEDKEKRGSRFHLDPYTKVVSFILPDESVRHIALYTERAKTDHMFLVFKALYDHWIRFPDQIITKIDLISKLKDAAWDDVDDYQIRHTIKNIRDTKIKPANLDSNIQIVGNRIDKGYRLFVNYP